MSVWSEHVSVDWNLDMLRQLRIGCGMSRELLAGEIEPEVAKRASHSLPKMKRAPEKLSLGWAHRYRKAYGWIKNVTNTQGVFLPYSHPKMQAARADFQSDLDAGLPF